MTDTNTSRRAATAAHILSTVFSPLLVPSFALAVALWCTVMRYLPTATKVLTLGAIAFITCLCPLIYIAILIKRGKVSDADISRRQERTAPFCAAVFCYIVSATLLLAMRAPAWLYLFFFGAAASGIIDLIITRRWKISAHCSGMGGLTALIVWLSLTGMIFGSGLMWISAAVAATGAVAWARLYLNRHTPLQTLAGAALSFVVEIIFLSLL